MASNPELDELLDGATLLMLRALMLFQLALYLTVSTPRAGALEDFPDQPSLSTVADSDAAASPAR